MAKQQSDVKLVIRAQNASSKAFKEIAEQIRTIEQKLKEFGRQTGFVESLRSARIEAEQARQKIAALEAEKKRLTSTRSGFTRKSPEYAFLTEQLGRINDQIKAQKKVLRPVANEVTRYERSLQKAGVEIKDLTAAQELLEAQTKETQAALRSAEQKSAQTEAAEARRREIAEEKKARGLASKEAQENIKKELALSKQRYETLRTSAVKTYRDIQAAAKKVSENNQFRDSIAQLAADYRRAGGSLQEWRKLVKAADGDIDKLTKSIRQHVAAKNQEIAATQKFRASAAQLAAAYRRAGGNIVQWRVMLKQANGDLDRLTLSVRKQIAAQERAAAAMARVARRGKTALTYYQRLRSQVLALVGAYAGFQGVGTAVRSVFDTQNDLIAAQNRFAVGFGGDQRMAAEELEYVRAVATSLKLPIEALIEDYSKFVASARDLSFTQQELRQIFVGVAKASVVQKLSVADLRGVYRALQQIMSKNQVMAEELRQQLGDRLPGAISIMATSLGVTTAELSKMMEQGEVSADALINFSKKLDEVYGTQLADALDSPRAKLNEFQNVLFNLRDEIAQSGFIDGLTDSLKLFGEELQRPDTRDAMIGLGKALGALARLALEVLKNWKLLAAAFAGFVGGKVIGVLAGILGGVKALLKPMGKLGKAVKGATGFMAKFGKILKFAGPILLRFAGPAGWIAGAVLAFTTFSSSADDATESLERFGSVAAIKRELRIGGTEDFDFGGEVQKTRLEQLNRRLPIEQIEADLEAAEGALREVKGKFRDARIDFEMGVVGADEAERRTNQLKAKVEELIALVELLKKGRDEYRAQEAAILRGEDPVKERVKPEVLTKDEQKALEKRYKFVEKTNKAIADAQAKSLKERLDNIRGVNDKEIAEDAALSEKLLSLRKQRQEKLAEIDARKNTTGGEDTARLLHEQELSNLDDQIAKMEELKEARQAALSIDTAGAVEEFTKEQLAAIREMISQAEDVGRTIDPAVVKARIRAIRDQLVAELAGAKGPAAESIQAALAQVDAAYGKFTRNVADKSATAVRKILSEGLRGIRETANRSVVLTGEADLAGVEQQFQELFARLGKYPQAAALGLIDQLEVEYRQFFNRALHEELSRVSDAVGEMVDRSLQERLEALRASVAMIQAEFQGKASPHVYQDVDKFARLEEERIYEAELNRLLEERATKATAIVLQREAAIITEREAIDATHDLNAEFEQLLQALAEMARIDGFGKIATKAEQAADGLMTVEDEIRITAQNINKDFVEGSLRAFDAFIQGTMSAKEAFRSFAIDFLRKIQEMILQKMILASIGSGGVGGFLGGLISHSGGIAGTGASREVPAWIYSIAPRMHNGGIAGLASDEVPAILRKGEEVITEGDPRHRYNGGTSPGSINLAVFDDRRSVEDYLGSTSGEQAVMAHIQRNSQTIKRMLF